MFLLGHHESNACEPQSLKRVPQWFGAVGDVPSHVLALEGLKELKGPSRCRVYPRRGGCTLQVLL